MKINSLPQVIVDVMVHGTPDGSDRMVDVKNWMTNPAIAASVTKWADANAKAINRSDNANLKELVGFVKEFKQNQAENSEDPHAETVEIVNDVVSGLSALFNWVTGKEKITIEENTLGEKLHLLYNGFAEPTEIAEKLFNGKKLDAEQIKLLLEWRDIDDKTLLDNPGRLEALEPLLGELTNIQIKDQFPDRDYDEFPDAALEQIVKQMELERQILSKVSPFPADGGERPRVPSDAATPETNAISVGGSIKMSNKSEFLGAMKLVLQEFEKVEGAGNKLKGYNNFRLTRIKEGKVGFLMINKFLLKEINVKLEERGIKIPDEMKLKEGQIMILRRKEGNLLIEFI